MTSLWAIVPVKPLEQGKSRLAAVLSAEARARLTQSLLTHLLVTIAATPGIDQTVVVTRDDDVATLARVHGVRVYGEENPLDLNVAVTGAFELARQRGATDVLVLPSDVPFVTVDDLRDLMVSNAAVVVCPDRHESGTNGLLLRDVDAFVFKYGPHSFHRHRGEAARRRLSAEIVRAPGLLFDLDTVEDWELYQARLAHV